MKHRLSIGIAVVVVAIGLALNSAVGASTSVDEQTAAQAAPPSTLTLVNVVRVKPDMVDQWIDFQTKQTIPAQKKGGVRQRDVYQSAVGNGFEYRIVQPMAKFADRDGPNAIMKALGEAGAREYNASNRKLVASTQSFIIQSVPDASLDPNPNAVYRILSLSTVHVAPGRTADYLDYLTKDLLPIQRKAQTKRFLVNRVLFGGDQNEYRVATFYEKWADLDAGPSTVRVLGQAGAAALGRKTAGIVTRSDRAIYVRNEALSFRTQITSTQ